MSDRIVVINSASPVVERMSTDWMIVLQPLNDGTIVMRKIETNPSGLRQEDRAIRLNTDGTVTYL